MAACRKWSIYIAGISKTYLLPILQILLNEIGEPIFNEGELNFEFIEVPTI